MPKKERLHDVYLTQLVWYGGLAMKRCDVIEDLRASWRKLPGHEHETNPETASKWARDGFMNTLRHENQVPPDTEVMLGKIVNGELVPDRLVTTTHDSRIPIPHVQQ